METPKPLPWHLVEAESTWKELVVPFIEAAIEKVTQTFIYAQTDAEVRLCQGQMLALRNILDAPENAAYIKARAEKIEDERLKALEATDGRRNTRRPARR